jgi:PAS domain S-box-containing protein
MTASAGAPGPLPADSFRWQALFQHSTDAVFVLDRQRRLRFVNRAWEALAGLPSAQARLLSCRKAEPATAEDSREEVLAHALCPPAEVLEGQAARVRRLLPPSDQAAGGRVWWDVEFFPLRDQEGVRGILGRVTPAAVVEPVAPLPLPETIAELRARSVQRFGFDQLPVSLPAMRRLAEQARLASQIAAPVLLVGEAGTGKHWLARLIHFNGPSRERSFAALDCGRLPVEAVLDVLLGERGDGQRGQLATIYLKDPASLPRDVQARLAERVGTRAGPHILAGCATPAADVRAGRMLDALHAALATLVIDVPPLRERAADLPLLVERLLERVPRKDGLGWKLTPAAWDVVRRYTWPGNLRQLADALAQACRHASAEVIDAADLPASVRMAVEGAVALPERGLPLDAILEQVERRLLELALQRTGGNRSRAAELLGIWRPRLNRRLEALGLAVPSAEIEIDEPESKEPSGGGPGQR